MMICTVILIYILIAIKYYNNYYFPRIFYIKPDGGEDSGVTGFFLIEWKCLFSIGLLKFREGTREAYHSHAFNALSWWLWGQVIEMRYKDTEARLYEPSVYPKITLKNNIHKVIATVVSYALTIRGPWEHTWVEYRQGKKVTLTHGRKILDENIS